MDNEHINKYGNIHFLIIIVNIKGFNRLHASRYNIECNFKNSYRERLLGLIHESNLNLSIIAYSVYFVGNSKTITHRYIAKIVFPGNILTDTNRF